MTEQDTVAPTLFELLARTWNANAPIQSLCLNAEQSAVAFLLDGGTIAIAQMGDDEPAESRIHTNAEQGRTTIRPRTKSPKPLSLFEMKSDGPIVLGRLGEQDFIASGQDGQVHKISGAEGTSLFPLEIKAPLIAVDQHPLNGNIACATQTAVAMFDESGKQIRSVMDDVTAPTAVKFSPDGNSIAVTHSTGLSVRSVVDGDDQNLDIEFEGEPRTISWSPDGQWISAVLADIGFQLICVSDGRNHALVDYPVPIKSIAWNKTANALITSGAFRVAAWSMDTPPIEKSATGALQTGKAGFVLVSAVSAHPERNLLVAGYENGFVSVMQIGGPDEMVLNSEDQGAITSIQWSNDGQHISCGTDKGVAMLISVPPQLFK